ARDRSEVDKGQLHRTLQFEGAIARQEYFGNVRAHMLDRARGAVDPSRGESLYQLALVGHPGHSLNANGRAERLRQTGGDAPCAVALDQIVFIGGWRLPAP